MPQLLIPRLVGRPMLFAVPSYLLIGKVLLRASINGVHSTTIRAIELLKSFVELLPVWTTITGILLCNDVVLLG